MSTKALLLTPVVFLATISVASALTFTWDPDPPPEGTQAPSQYEVVMTRLKDNAMTQQTEPLTLLDQGTCQAIYQQAGEPAFNPDTSHCATIQCPGPGAYTALLHADGVQLQAKDVNNSSSFGLTPDCKLMSFEDALMQNLPDSQAKPATGTTGATGSPGTQVAGGAQTDPTTTNAGTTPDDSSSSTDSQDGATSTPSGNTTPATGQGSTPATGTGTTGSPSGTHMASLPAPRVLDADVPQNTGTPGSGTTQPGTTGTDSSTSGSPSTGTPSTGSTSSTSGTTGSTSGGTTPGTTSTGTTNGGTTTGTTNGGSTAGNPSQPSSPTTTGGLGSVIDPIVKQLQTISTDYDKARKALDAKYKTDLQAALKQGGAKAITQMSQIYAKVIQDDTKLFQDTLKKWDEAYAKLPQPGTTPGTGGTGTTSGANTPVAGGTTPSTTGSTTASANGTGAPGTTGMSNDPQTTQVADAGDSDPAKSSSSSSSVSGTHNGQPFTGMPRETHGITTITVNGAQQPSASGADGTTVKDKASKSSTSSDSQTARVVQ